MELPDVQVYQEHLQKEAGKEHRFPLSCQVPQCLTEGRSVAVSWQHATQWAHRQCQNTEDIKSGYVHVLHQPVTGIHASIG